MKIRLIKAEFRKLIIQNRSELHLENALLIHEINVFKQFVVITQEIKQIFT